MVIAIDFLTIALLWLAVILITPRLSGWNKLASLSRAPGPPSGERFPFEFGKIGSVYFWYCITLYRAPQGIYPSPSRIFLFGQPPLLIPWSELRNPREKRLFFSPMQEFDVGSPSVATLELRSDIVKNHARIV
jgi:hypothetical protein